MVCIGLLTRSYFHLIRTRAPPHPIDGAGQRFGQITSLATFTNSLY